MQYVGRRGTEIHAPMNVVEDAFVLDIEQKFVCLFVCVVLILFLVIICLFG